jgi:hypothetical protein
MGVFYSHKHTMVGTYRTSADFWYCLGARCVTLRHEAATTMTEEDWQNNEEYDLEDEVVAMVIAREQMEADLGALERKINRVRFERSANEQIAGLASQYHEQARALQSFNCLLEQRGIEFLIASGRPSLDK